MRQPHTNPHFRLTRAQAAALLRPDQPKLTLIRPLVVIGGYRGPMFSILPIQRGMAPRLTNPELLSLIASPLAASFDAAVARARAHIQRSVRRSEEIDVIGHSMGGLIARVLAQDSDLPRIRRLFTLATPHQGATIARFIAIDPAARSMRAGSEFLRTLDSVPLPPHTELHCYARLGDWWVGARNCAPRDRGSYWLDADTLPARFLGHFSITRDERILADLLEKLIGADGYTAGATQPPAN